MKITSIELTNFKAIGERVVIPVRPITLIFGANSAGKSSILQCLAMLAQSVTGEKRTGMDGSILSSTGLLVDVGNYRDFVHEHNTGKPFECKFNFDMDMEHLFDYSLPDNMMATEALSLHNSAKKFKKTLAPFREGSLAFCFRYTTSKEVVLYNIDLFLGADDKPVFSYSPMDWDFQSNTNHIFWEKYWEIFNKEINDNSDFEMNHITHYLGFLPSKFANLKPEEFICAESFENMHYEDGIDFTHPQQLIVLFASKIKSFLDNFSYLGPLRKKPERFYVAEDAPKGPESGDGVDVTLFLALDDVLVRRVNLELAQLQTGYQIKIVHLNDPNGVASDVFLLQFINQKTGVAASIKDVGFGFSQILPVIVQCLKSQGSNVIIEQPELHLHPAMQAELGDMFIRGATEQQWSQEEYDAMLIRLSSSEAEIPNNWKNRHNRFFIETHSEHLILRLLRRIRETTEGELPENVPPITPDDIAVLYVQPGNNGAQVIHIPVTAEGEFATLWPGGFFAERARELF